MIREEKIGMIIIHESMMCGSSKLEIKLQVLCLEECKPCRL